ncbi:MAG: HAD-IA family hydrolase [Planktomarina sp.]
MKPCVVFDLDGTLADTSADLLAAANACFRQMGLGDVLEHGRDSATALRGGRAMLTLGLERVGWDDVTAEAAKQHPNLLAHYDAYIDTQTQFYDGALEAVETLKRQGFAVSICTNKPEGLAIKLMQRLGALDLFDALVGADTMAYPKPNTMPYWAAVDRAGGERAKSLLVGDSDTDRKTAANAGVPSVLVTFGPAGGDMAALNPEALLKHFNDLPDLARNLLG